MATTHGPFTFDTVNDTDCQRFDFTSTNGGAGQTTANVISAAGTAAEFCHDTNGGNSSGTGPDQGQGGVGDGYLYTECSSPGANGDTYTMTFDTILDASAEQWQFNFYTLQRGNNVIGENQTTCEVQINENSGGWVTIVDVGGAGEDVTNGTTWTSRSVDLSESGVNTDSSTQVRLLITTQGTTQAYYGDYGVDTVSIVGTDLSTTEYTQASFRGRKDNGSETGADWKAALNTNWSQAYDTTFRVRFLIQETTDDADSNDFDIEYNHEAGGWTSLGASGALKIASTTNYANWDDSTQQIGSGTLIANNNSMLDLAASTGTVAWTTTVNQEIEIEVAVEIDSGVASPTDTIQVRVVRGGGAVLDVYTNTPTITVLATTLVQEGFRWRDDNGTEITASWLELQDVNTEQPVTDIIRLRMLIDQLGDIGTNAMRLQYRRKDEAASEWRDV